MLLKTFTFEKNDSWSEIIPPDWNSGETLILVFGASVLFDDNAELKKLYDSFSNSKIIGCSTAGEIFGETISDEGLSGAAIKFERTCLDAAYTEVSSAGDSFAAGAEIARKLLKPGLRGVFILSDGLHVNGTRLVAGLNSILPPEVIVTGGLAGDNDRFEKTWVLKDGIPQSKIVSAVGFYGDAVRIGHGSKGGWDIFGPERKVTKADGNKLFELDGKPALELYKNYLGERAAELPASALLFPLAIRDGFADQKLIVRTILGVDENNQSMTFAGDIPQGATAQLMRANFDRLIDGAAEAALMTERKKITKREMLSIAISCVGRRLILGERAEEELEAVLDIFPDETKQIGFYSYGEISPFAPGKCDLHNQTMTITTISEE